MALLLLLPAREIRNSSFPAPSSRPELLTQYILNLVEWDDQPPPMGLIKPRRKYSSVYAATLSIGNV